MDTDILYSIGFSRHAIFRLDGRSPLIVAPLTDEVVDWPRIIKRCKDYGPNHIRFHSWCLPEAAFVASDAFEGVDLLRGGLRHVGEISVSLQDVHVPSHLRLRVSLDGTPYRNSWKIWIYDEHVTTGPPTNVVITRALNRETMEMRMNSKQRIFLEQENDE